MLYILFVLLQRYINKKNKVACLPACNNDKPYKVGNGIKS